MYLTSQINTKDSIHMEIKEKEFNILERFRFRPFDLIVLHSLTKVRINGLFFYHQIINHFIFLVLIANFIFLISLSFFLTTF
jgi:hypothetical protein